MCSSVNVSQLHILHNGEVVDTVSDANHIMLDVDPAELGDAGTYSCQVVFTDSSNITADMGTLTVVGKSQIITIACLVLAMTRLSGF